MIYWTTIALFVSWAGIFIWAAISGTDLGWMFLVLGLFLLVCVPLYFLLSTDAARIGFIVLNLCLLGVVLYESIQGSADDGAADQNEDA
jgi:hypothetical protein